MQQSEKVHFVASGGAISGHHETGFQQFTSLVEKSHHKDRHHILGWLPNESIPGLYAESDLGINVDLDIYESHFGSRCRIVNWMQAGLPCLTTLTTELSKIVAENQIGFVFPPGNSDEMAEMIVRLVNNSGPLRQAGLQAQRYAKDNFAFSATITPLLNWLKAPRRAPDLIDKGL